MFISVYREHLMFSEIPKPKGIIMWICVGKCKLKPS